MESILLRKEHRENDDIEKEYNEDEDDEATFNFGFKSPRTPPGQWLLKPFESAMYQMITDIKFKDRPNTFQQKLKEDVRRIRSSEKLLIPADKSTNLYEVGIEQYNKLLTDNVTKTYKKSPTNEKARIDSDAKNITDSLGLSDRVQQLAEKEAFINLKDHKPNFKNNPSCRLINPAKSEIGHISKSYLENLVAEVTEVTGLNQWRKTSSVIDWFKNIPDKKHSSLLQFDIVDFYPSITEELLDKSINFAKTHGTITDEQVRAIKHARQSLLFRGNEQWMKKNGEGLFDITMGSFDGAEACEIVGLYLLDKLSSLLGKDNVGLYRDDGLGAVRSKSGRRLDNIRKNIIELFKEEGLTITISMNLQIADFLDATFDISRGLYYPFRKPDNKPLYINRDSNHPPTVLKEIPNMINQRLSSLSCNEEVFNRSKLPYEKALADSGFQAELKYKEVPSQEPDTRQKRKRKRKTIWFNPPFSSNVKTNIGRKFLKLIAEHFPPNHRYSKIFNRSNIKLSYSCMPNVSSAIKQHNSSLLNPEETNGEGGCNCNVKDNCPLNGACQVKCVVYAAEVTTPNDVRLYHGTAEGYIKPRISKHNTSFSYRQYEHNTTLSTYIWTLKDSGTPYTIKWSITAKARKLRCSGTRCDLCLTEKMMIARSDHPGLLNSRSELLNKCRHRNKFLLSQLKN